MEINSAAARFPLLTHDLDLMVEFSTPRTSNFRKYIASPSVLITCVGIAARARGAAVPDTKL